ncbi:MAG: hypothetical protein OXT67_14055 [Zetaproteobacteria bacterium]|nr:hypothetical protein [Zetaproteobacteria bacterium]
MFALSPYTLCIFAFLMLCRVKFYRTQQLLALTAVLMAMALYGYGYFMGIEISQCGRQAFQILELAGTLCVLSLGVSKLGEKLGACASG